VVEDAEGRAVTAGARVEGGAAQPPAGTTSPSSAPTDLVLSERDPAGVLTLTLHRPERHNAWTYDLEMALHDALEGAATDDTVRAVVLTGAGRSFCPGLDAQELDRVSRPDQGFNQQGRRPMQLPALVPKPVVCAINGACAGLGLITALMCDVRFAAEDAKIATAFTRRGLPAEEAVAWILPRIVGHAAALDLILSGRVVRGDEAAALGLVHRACPKETVLEDALEYARDMAVNCSPLAMATAKRQIYDDWERSFADSRRYARRAIDVLKASGDFREGTTSYVERRPPQFPGHAEAVDTTILGGRT
jgi:enoyl-CoA hydratase/carnithine racemase